MLDFKPITLDEKEITERYFYRYGENSCQHSFVSMYCMSVKYNDMFCERDGFIYILRDGTCTEDERIYLFPMGDFSDEAGLKCALENVLSDARAHGKKAAFVTVTERSARLAEKLMPGTFRCENVRDFAEYIYTREKLAELPGKAMASKRYDIKTFMRDYGERCVIEKIEPRHIDDIMSFQEKWLSEMLRDVVDVQLDLENESIKRGLSAFSELGLSGIVIYIDGVLCGYAYGAPLSEDCYDVMIEKGDRTVTDIYRVLNRDLVRLCCEDFEYINREEDMGVEGLRKAKLSYKPDILLEKYILREADAVE